MNLYYVYILKCSDNSYYTGITSDIERRYIEHKTGLQKNCYTYRRRPLTLEFVEEFQDVIQAIYFEKQIKGWTRAKKQALINGDFGRLQMLSECRNTTHYKYKPE